MEKLESNFKKKIMDNYSSVMGLYGWVDGPIGYIDLGTNEHKTRSTKVERWAATKSNDGHPNKQCESKLTSTHKGREQMPQLI